MAPSFLTPAVATRALLDLGTEHLHTSLQLTFLKGIYGGLLLSIGGLLSLILATGVPTLTSSNPGLQRLFQGLLFPIGLILTSFVDASLFTAYPMLYAFTAFERRGRPAQYIIGPLVTWVGNLGGAAFVAAVLSVATETVTEEPFRSAIVKQVVEDIVQRAWHVIFLRAIGCGFLVTLAMFCGMQSADASGKALGLHLPFFMSVTAKFPHVVEYMYLCILGMMLGAPLSVGAFFGKCLAPITLGNMVGGFVFTGLYNWWVFMKCEREKTKLDVGEFETYHDEEQ